MVKLIDLLGHIILIGTWCGMLYLTACARQPQRTITEQAEVICLHGSTNVRCPNPYR